MKGNSEANQIKQRLHVLDKERATLLARLDRIEIEQPSIEQLESSPVFSPSEKIAIFSSLFRGREDVHPKRWENQKTGKAGYSPACGNEWVRGICGKPKVKVVIANIRRFCLLRTRCCVNI